ncbi:MAG: response regulator transcription factor [Flavobacteriales bacterium]|nr:response regulator transcription factor [Flavobacteriales bacterium]
MADMIRVVIVEDDAEVSAIFSGWIERSGDMRLVRSFSSGTRFLEDMAGLQVDVVLMDIHMPGENGIACVERAKPLMPGTQFLMLTMFDDPPYVFQALCAGATGYLLKDASTQELLDAVRDIHRGGSPMSPAVARLVVASFQKEAHQRITDHMLTDRERVVLHHLAAGHMYKEIGELEGISIETVRSHVRKIYGKLQVHTRLEAIRKAFPEG